MTIFPFPDESQWAEYMRRPVQTIAEIEQTVRTIIEDVRISGDEAVRRYSTQFDGVVLPSFALTQAEIHAAEQYVPQNVREAIQQAYKNITLFHESQREPVRTIETMPGVRCWRKSIPLERVGLYIPGGTAPLFSTVLMLGVPAQIAGCPMRIMCSPPSHNQTIIHPAILYAARLVGIEAVYAIGGVQAIAAMATGTESIPQVNKIFGPGNQYVTAAKQLMQQYGVAIDMPAGPSEVLVIADKTCNPVFVAADLLSQAEHGADSQVICLVNSEQLAETIVDEVERQVSGLPRHNIALKALQNSRCIVLSSLDAMLRFANEYAPEHLILATDHANNLAEKVTQAGSVFLGHYTPESAGDYASGTNHTLPTNGYARAYSGVSLDSFVKKITFQQLTPEGLQNLAPTVETMAEAEELIGHQRAVMLRRLTL